MSRILNQLNDDALDFTVEITTDGKKKKFEFLDIILYNSVQYLVLAPFGKDYVEIFKIVACDTDLERYEIVTDDDILNNVFELFRIKNEDEYDFE